MHAWVQIAAIACNFIGVVLMVRYGLPNDLPLLGRTVPDLTEIDVVERDRRSLLGVVGLVLFGFGSAVQIVGAG